MVGVRRYDPDACHGAQALGLFPHQQNDEKRASSASKSETARRGPTCRSVGFGLHCRLVLPIWTYRYQYMYDQALQVLSSLFLLRIPRRIPAITMVSSQSWWQHRKKKNGTRTRNGIPITTRSTTILHMFSEVKVWGEM
jgi:hypothetical protein